MTHAPDATKNRMVFWVSASMILLFVLIGAALPEPMQTAFSAAQTFIVTQLGWFYVLSVTGFLLFVVWLFISPFGSIRLGADDEEPEYNTLTWFAMLFSAGMGIGLLFFSVAEPMSHFIAPPRGDAAAVAAALESANAFEVAAREAAAGGDTQRATELSAQAAAARAPLFNPAQRAMTLTFYHWGLHAWAIYLIIGLSLAYFAYRHGLPLTIRSTLYPLLGNRIYGWPGDLVEILAIFGTLFGVATSLGLGVQQINAGLAFLGLVEVSTAAQLVLIALVTALATVSVASGLDVGIRRLSEANLGLSLLLVAFVFLAGPTAFLVSEFVQSLGAYLSSLPELTFRTDAIRGTQWQASWTMFYWGWWISWSPFVGMFIARISRGRTIRSLVGGVLLAPALLTFIWMVVFGGTSLHHALFDPTSQIITTLSGDDGTPKALFAMLYELPWAAVSAGLATVVIAIYFVTSSDSASLVIDILANNGNPEPPLASRIFWSVLEGAVAAVLLYVGGNAALQALQTAAITTALPFCAVMLLICWSLVKGLQAERAATATGTPFEAVDPRAVDEPEAADEVGQEWRHRLETLLARPGSRGGTPSSLQRARTEAQTFLERTVLPAFRDLRRELERHGRRVQIERHGSQAFLIVRRQEAEEFRYGIRTRLLQRQATAFPEFQHHPEPPRVVHGEVILRGGVQQDYPLDRFTRQNIIDHFLDEYARWAGW